VELPQELLDDQTKAIIFWVIFENPADFPGQFVVRRNVLLVGNANVSDSQPTGYAIEDKPWLVVESLSQARALIPDDCYNLGRQNGDEPQIVEVWIR